MKHVSNDLTNCIETIIAFSINDNLKVWWIVNQFLINSAMQGCLVNRSSIDIGQIMC